MSQKDELDLFLKPKKIVDHYIDDYDITYIHDIIMSQLLQEKKNCNKLNEEIIKLEELLKKPQIYNVKKDLITQIEELKIKLNDINQDVKLTEYQNKTKDLLTNYIIKKKNKDFLEKHKIIDSYLIIASKYIDIHVKRLYQSKENCCINCHSSLRDVKINQEGTLRCHHCQTDHQVIINECTSFDCKLNVMGVDNDMENFRRALIRFEGLQDRPNKIIYEKLDNYFKERGMPSSKEIKKMPLNDRGKKDGTSREILIQALSAIKYSEYYEDCNLIANELWGWVLPNLTHVREKIYKHYSITQKIFYKIPLEVRGRISSLGTAFRCYKHLQLVHYPCYQEDFKIADNPTSLSNHIKLWKMMCELSDDPEIYYID